MRIQHIGGFEHPQESAASLKPAMIWPCKAEWPSPGRRGLKVLH